MFNWLIKKVKKDEFEQHKGAVQTALNTVKQDMSNISTWIKHLDKQDSEIKTDVNSITSELSSMKNEIEEIKKMISESNAQESQPIFKQRQTVKYKQTAVYANQTAVQTAVQAAFFTKLSISEKALIMILVNSELKLSYEDLAAMMGKDTATIRGQINSIKQKVEGLIEEQIERNNKKRLYIPDRMKNVLLKRMKVRQNREKTEENE
jgi:DNA-directed RNA polymerase specialized sigma24 family protein